MSDYVRQKKEEMGSDSGGSESSGFVSIVSDGQCEEYISSDEEKKMGEGMEIDSQPQNDK